MVAVDKQPLAELAVTPCHAAHRRLKTQASDRDAPIPGPLGDILAIHAVRVPCGPAEMVFPGRLGDYGWVRRVWQRTCAAAGLGQCRLHDLRHTFGVHAARAGVPLVRLQRLMGHSTPTRTLRYMRHAPDGDFVSDAERVASSMSLAVSREDAARAELVRRHIRRA